MNLLPVRQNPERTFYWFFEAACPVARDKGEPSVIFAGSTLRPDWKMYVLSLSLTVWRSRGLASVMEQCGHAELSVSRLSPQLYPSSCHTVALRDTECSSYEFFGMHQKAIKCQTDRISVELRVGYTSCFVTRKTTQPAYLHMNLMGTCCGNVSD